MAEMIRERGYFDTTIGDIVHRAYTSRRTFYEHFASKQECFLAMHDQRTTEQNQQVTAAVDSHGDLPTQVRQAINVWLATVEADPAVELSWIRDIPKLGDDGRRLQRDHLEDFVRQLRTLTDTADLRAAGVKLASRHTAIMVLGGLNELVAVTLEDGGDVRDIAEAAIDITLAILDPGG